MSQEQEWVRRAQDGDAGAFEQLVLLHQQKIYHLALRLCGNSEDAQEAVQEAFLSAWKHLPSFRGEAGFSTWLYRLTVNACNDLFRRRKTPAGLLSLDDEEEVLQLRDPQPLPQEEAERNELRRNVQQALLQLSPPHREVLLLRELQQLSYEEISSVLSLDTGTVKSRIHRARSQLREILLKQGTFSPPPASKATEAKGKEHPVW